MWLLTVIEKYLDGYLLMSPIGDTQYVSEQQYEQLKEQGRIQNGIDSSASSKKI